MKIAILGLGTVGLGVYNILTNDFDNLTVKYVLDLDKSKTKGLQAISEKSFEEIINDKEVSTIVELIGGTGVAYKFIEKALKNGKNVVTANKAVISKYYQELTELANKNQVKLLYEASVGGAIIVLDPLKSISKINQITSVSGIINGSTNFVLSKIFNENISLDKALTSASLLGYIETGSFDDIEGFDLLRKINILAMISFHQYIKENDIIRIPLSDLTNEFYDYIKSNNLLIKYEAQAFKENSQLMIHLEPLVVNKTNLLAKINYEKNIINISGKYHPKQSFIGSGAGRYPTAQAVVYDLLSIYEKRENEVSYTNNFVINQKLKKYRFLVQKKKGFSLTQPCFFNDVLADKEIICFARVSEECYEKL